MPEEKKEMPEEKKEKVKDCYRGCIHKNDNFLGCAMYSVDAKNKVANKKSCDYFRT